MLFGLTRSLDLCCGQNGLARNDIQYWTFQLLCPKKKQRNGFESEIVTDWS